LLRIIPKFGDWSFEFDDAKAHPLNRRDGSCYRVNFRYPIPFVGESSFDAAYQFTRSERLLQ
jgi:hypothetical protein